MTLTLSILRCPDRVAPETRRFEGGEVIIGRGPGADWVLTDTAAKPLLSRRHCTIAFRAGDWVLIDTSTNGTTLNGTPAQEGQPTRAFRDGDRLGIGPYEIEVGLAEERSAFSGASAPRDEWLSPEPHGASPFGASPFAENSDSGMGGGIGLGGDPFAGPSIKLPEDFGSDLLEPSPFSRPPAQPDHTPSFGDVIQPPAPRAVLPNFWDDEPAAAAPPAPSVPPEPVFIAASPEPLPPQPQVVPLAAPCPAPASVPAPPPSPAPADTGLLAAFLEGTGLTDAVPANATKAMREAGAAFRAFVHGLRRVLIARAEVKSAFRIDQTMVRSRGNNPLKFAVSDDDALAALLGAGRRTDMPAADAVDGALSDIRLHELATMAAMQEAMTDLLGKLEPAQFLAAASGFLPAQKRAHAYDLYEAEFKKLREAFSEKFDDAFGRAFARAYERVIADLQSREPLH